MADYSYNEIMKMQNDAIRRVNEMQKRAKSVVNDINEEETSTKKAASKSEATVKRVKMPNDYLEELKGFAATSSYFENNEETDKRTTETKNVKQDTNNEKEHIPKNQPDIFKNLLGGMDLDSDKALILSLILLLTEEKGDEMLILSLLYMLT